MILKNMSGIYIFYENKILIMKRSKKEFNSVGQYFSIGGKFEPNELNQPKKCLLRELEEETGLIEGDIDNLQLKYIIIRNHNGTITLNHLFFANLIKAKELKTCNEGTLEWVPIEEIFNKPLPDSSRVCLKHYFAGGMKSQEITVAVATNDNGYLEYNFTNISRSEKNTNNT